MKFKIVSLGILSGLAAQPCRALTLDQAITDFLARSPLVRAQSSVAEISNGDRWRRFLPKEPQFQMSGSDDGSAETYSLAMTTSFPGKSVAYGRVDRARAEADRLELAARRHEAAKLIMQSYLDCASSKALAMLQGEIVDEFRTLARSLKVLYESGHSTQAEKIGAELQLRQATADLEAASGRALGSCKKWLEIYGPGDEEAVFIPDDLAPSTLREFGPRTADQARGKAQIANAEAANATRWWAQAPDITWSVARNHYLYLPASPSGKEWSTTVSFSLTIPLLFPFSESVEAQRVGAQAAIDRASGELQLLNADSDRAEAVKEFSRGRKRLTELRKTDIPLAEALVESTSAAYKSGKLGYSELILSRKTLSDLRTQEIQTRLSILGARLRCLEDCEKGNDRP